MNQNRQQSFQLAHKATNKQPQFTHKLGAREESDTQQLQFYSRIYIDEAKRIVLHTEKEHRFSLHFFFGIVGKLFCVGQVVNFHFLQFSTESAQKCTCEIDILGPLQVCFIEEPPSDKLTYICGCVV